MRARTLAFVCGLWLAGCVDETSDQASPSQLDLLRPGTATIDDPIEPLPLSVEVDARKVALGQRLFDDPLLSGNGKQACSTCHHLANGGDDGRPKSHQEDRQPAILNTPTVFNLVFNFKYHWGGGYSELAAQLAVPVESPRVYATTFDEIVKKLQGSADYRRAFSAIYPEGITKETLTDAIVELERSFITPNAPFDKFMRGDESAISERQKAGYALFKSHGCISCHQGMNVGGNMFQKLGVMREFFEERGEVGPGDLGRYNVTKRDEDRHVFRVPSLRNVAVTGPYFHDGSVETLEEAVQVMSEYQLGRPLTKEQVSLIVEFLGTLTGEYQGKVLQ